MIHLTAKILSLLSIIPQVSILGLGIINCTWSQRKCSGFFAIVMGALGSLFSGMIAYEIATHPPSDVFWFNVALISFPLSLLALVGHVRLLRNLKQSEQTESALRESERQYRTLSELAHDMIFMVGPDNTVLYVNAFAAGQLRKEPQDIIGQSIMALFPPEAGRRMAENLQKVFRSGDALYIETQIGFPGTEKWLDSRLVPLKNEKGLIYGVYGLSRDISERKAAEQATRASEEKYRMLVERASECIFLYGKTGLIDEANPRACEISGFSREELVGKNPLEFVPMEQRAAVGQVFQRLQTENHISLELQQYHKNGQLRDIAATISTLPDGRFLGMARDITDQKRSQEYQRFIQFSMDNSDEGVFWVDSKGQYVQVNETACRVLEYRREELLTMCVSQVDPRIPVGESWQARWDSFKQNRRIDPFESVHRTKSGRLFPVELRGTFLVFDGKEYICSFARDISERKAAQDALSAEKERLMVTLRGIGDGVISTDPFGKIVLMNGVAENLCGQVLSACAGKPFDVIFPLLDERNHLPRTGIISRLVELAANTRMEPETLVIMQEGKERFISVIGAPLRDRQDQIIGTVLVLRDITDQRKMEDELLRSQKLESLGVLAGGIAHDFNNILTVILGNISLSKLVLKKGGQVGDKLDEALKAVHRARDLTQQLMTFSKAGEPIKKATSISELIVESSSFVLHGTPFKCEYSLPPDLWPVEADEGQISRVVTNLVINAKQAMGRGGCLRIRAENVTLHASSSLPLIPGRYVRLLVADEGCGIPEDVLSRIFDPYFSTKPHGNGLGLAISYSIIRRHGGAISVESTVGKGTTFTIHLPAASSPIQTAKPGQIPGFKGHGRILVMDDESSICQMAGEALKELGYEPAFAADGLEAMEKYKTAFESGFPFRAVIMDLTIPGGMGGQEAIKHFLAFDPEVKGIVSSGYSIDPIMGDFLAYGFVSKITKPYRVEELQLCLCEVFSGPRED